jgi:hypothetical protein
MQAQIEELCKSLYKEKVPKIRVCKTVTPRCKFNYVNMIKKRENEE